MPAAHSTAAFSIYLSCKVYAGAAAEAASALAPFILSMAPFMVWSKLTLLQRLLGISIESAQVLARFCDARAFVMQLERAGPEGTVKAVIALI
eukprot:111359-Pelagomonas_calceolata.AAC.2